MNRRSFSYGPAISVSDIDESHRGQAFEGAAEPPFYFTRAAPRSISPTLATSSID
jgi:hypothetical protein